MSRKKYEINPIFMATSISLDREYYDFLKVFHANLLKAFSQWLNWINENENNWNIFFIFGCWQPRIEICVLSYILKWLMMINKNKVGWEMFVYKWQIYKTTCNLYVTMWWKYWKYMTIEIYKIVLSFMLHIFYEDMVQSIKMKKLQKKI